MNKEQAFSILEQALNVANQKGVFLLADAAVIQTALAVTRDELKIPYPEPAVVEDNHPQGNGVPPAESVRLEKEDK